MDETTETEPTAHPHTARIVLVMAVIFAVLLAWQVQRGEDRQHHIDEITRRQGEQLLDDNG